MVLRRQFLLLVWSALLAAALPAQAGGSRVKDLVMVAGARDNQLVGYGLVTGLAGDGDKNPVYTLQSIANALQRYGITVPSATLSSKNVAAVMVTADIPAFKKPGTPDVTILAGDAKSLQGGVLLQTPCSALMGRSCRGPGRLGWRPFRRFEGAAAPPCRKPPDRRANHWRRVGRTGNTSRDYP